MIETIGNWINAVIGWASVIPIEGWAIIAGVVIGSAATQWFKRTIPVGLLFPASKQGFRVMWIRTVAFVLSFLPTFFIWQGPHGVWVAMAVGFATPAVYSAFTSVLYKYWPHLETKISGTTE